MRHIPFRGLCRALTQRTLVQPPSVWGKLPAYGDFIHHNVGASAQDAWHDWVRTYWHRRPPSRQSASAARAGSFKGWIEVSQRPARADLSSVPVAFVLPPGYLPKIGDVFVQGVMVPSEDKVGRSCPLVIYQTVHRSWMQRTWACPVVGVSDRSIGRGHEQGRHVLYWWARLAGRLQHSEAAFDALVKAVDQVWTLHEPGWSEWLGRVPMPAEQEALASLMAQFGRLGGQDAADPLRGVYHLPWADWPERTLRAVNPLPAFWLQDRDGGYVNASDNVLQLWGVRA